MVRKFLKSTDFYFFSVVGVIVIIFCIQAGAVDIVKEAPIYKVGTATTVSVSTSTWTKVPTASTLTRRAGIKVCNRLSNNASIYGVISTAAPTISTTTTPIEIEKGENPFIPVGDDHFLYLLSGHTSAENAHVQEVGQ